MLENLWGTVKSLASFRSKVMRLTGPVNGSGPELTTMYVGNGTNLAFVFATVFGEQAAECEIGRCNIWRAGAQEGRHAVSADMVVIDVPWPYDIAVPGERHIVEVPAWVRQEVRLAETWEGVIAGLRKSVRDGQLRKIRNFGLSWTSTRDPAQVDSFYDTMYVPHIRRRFGAAAQLESRRHIQKCVAGGRLLQIVRNGGVIAACVLLDRSVSLQLLFVGFSAADLREIDGASAALYYYTLAYAFENGYRKVDFCGSRPFLNDGVLAIKRRWGAAIYDDWSLESLLIQMNELNPGVEAFLQNHPMITCEGDELIARVLTGDKPLSAAKVRKTCRQYGSPGLDGLKIYATRGISDEAFDVAKSSSLPLTLVDLRESADPLQDFCN